MSSSSSSQFQRKKPLQQAIAGAITIFLLSGCDVIRNMPPILPTFPLPSSPSPSSADAAQSAAAAQMESDVLQQINAIRQQNGLSPLKDNPKLAQVARRYSQRMAEQNFFSHTAPEGDTMVDRVRSARIFYFALGENLFKGTNLPDPATDAVEGWMNSPGHRRNILQPEYREMGIGVWRQGNTYYFTQLLMRSL
ncbi:CAP domain-containing protein [Oscillatoria sp. FACHB-1407]|uniref:CAP domain-containing protein n=1 Tax=Oscillatoria sp. FACHB-1407 TaxID=2692847 RepID=UPI001687459D|nr:CAP domain-containing protein [Oscillatoria sp. FACHB-1407]MBD2459487.1 CAP domain-containing protein [Oscillatoria sp. FACHB-1407]